MKKEILFKNLTVEERKEFGLIKQVKFDLDWNKIIVDVYPEEKIIHIVDKLENHEVVLTRDELEEIIDRTR